MHSKVTWQILKHYHFSNDTIIKLRDSCPQVSWKNKRFQKQSDKFLEEEIIITEPQGLEGTSGDHPARSSAKAVPCSWLHRKASWWDLNVSWEGDSTAAMGSLFQCSVALKEVFPTFARNLLCSSLCPQLLVLLLHTTTKSLALCSWHLPFRYW